MPFFVRPFWWPAMTTPSASFFLAKMFANSCWKSLLQHTAADLSRLDGGLTLQFLEHGLTVQGVQIWLDLFFGDARHSDDEENAV